ncbi:MAG: outer membrane beta-barrel protein [Planctomycetia bacterium]|nr:outer membrane beta-barrel protein [Planctomycetia bacterium]
MGHSLNKIFLTAILWGLFSIGAFGQELLMESGQILSGDIQRNEILSTETNLATQGDHLTNIVSSPLTTDEKADPSEATISTTSDLLKQEDSIIPFEQGSGMDQGVGALNEQVVDSNGYFSEEAFYYDANNCCYDVNNCNEYCNDNAVCGSSLNGGLFSRNRMPGSRFFVDGWVETGANSNSTWPITTAAGGTVNDEASSFQMNQLYLSFGLETIKCNQISLGGRVDLLYGTDYLYTSSLGLEVGTTNAAGMPVDSVYAARPKWNRNSKGGFSQYGLAMPQAYAEVYVPSGEGLTVKMGHFYSPIGYESVMPVSNFFYTHSYTMLYGEPQTVTGLMATQKLNANWSILGGFTQGWNVWEDPNDKMSFIAGAKWEDFCKRTSLSFTIMSGDELSGVEDSKVTNYSLVYQQQLNPCMQYVLQHDMGFADNGGYGYNANGQLERMNARWASLVNYLYWQLTEETTLGLRFEWFQDQNLSRVLALPVYNNIPLMQNKWEGENFYNLSLGLNWKPTSWLTVRPEIRYDWSDLENVDENGNPIVQGVYDDFTKKELFTVGGDVVIRF